MNSGVARPVTSSTTVIIHRALAGYCLFNSLSGIELLLVQLPLTERWWSLTFLPAYAVVLGVMIYRAVRRRSVANWAGAYAVLTVIALISGVFAFHEIPDVSWLWWTVGQAVVCAFAWRGLIFGLVFGAGLSALYGLFRTLPAYGGRVVEIAISDGLFAFAASITIGFTLVGMIRAGEAADALAARVSAGRVAEAVQAAMSAERARLDRVIHDEVMTALTSAAHAADPATERGARELAQSSLEAIEHLQDQPLPTDLLSGDLLTRLCEETVQRVSPLVSFVDRRPSDRPPVDIPAVEAEAMVSATREAVRNAVRHAGATSILVVAEQDRGRDDQSARISFVVSDDGRGFDPGAVPAGRLGVRLSVVERMTSIGGQATIASRVGQGTWVTVTREFASTGRLLAADPLDPADAGMPAAFPERALSMLTWFIILSMMGLGLAGLDSMTVQWPSLAAMALIVVVTSLLLKAGPGLKLPTLATVVVAAAAITANVLMAVFLKRDGWPGYGMWTPFPIQLILVILVLRQRLGTAILVWATAIASYTAWAVALPNPVDAVVSIGFGLTSFLVLGIFVNRGLLSISRHQHRLQVQEAADLEGSVRRHVAQVQRSLWVSDLRATVRDVLVRIRDSDSPFSADLERECLLLESTLRESLAARNLMSEQLSKLTEDARRRGVSLTFVDSRSTPAPRAISRAVLAEVQSALARKSTNRVVVRLAPDRDASASVVSSDDTTTSLTTIDDTGRKSTPLE